MRMRVNFFDKTGLRLLQSLMVMGGLIIILNGVEVAMAQWVSHGPPGGDVRAIAIDPQDTSILLSGTYGGGIYRSNDGGTNWIPTNNDLANLYVLALAVDPHSPSTIYAGTEGGAYKSINTGDSWKPKNSGLNAIVLSLAIDPQNTATIYAGTPNGVYKSTNGGETWTAVNNGLTVSGFNLYTTALAVDPKTSANIYAGTISVGYPTPAGTAAFYGGGVYKSTDGGMSWMHITNGLPAEGSVRAIAFDPHIPSTIYAAMGDEVYKSTDAGTNWQANAIGGTHANIQTLAIDPLNPSTLYAGTWEGIFKSTDGGVNWYEDSNGLRIPWVNALAVDPQSPGAVYAGTNASLYKTSDGGANWHPSYMGLLNARVGEIAIDPQAPATIYATTYEGLNKSVDGGISWNLLDVNGGHGCLAIDPQDPATIYVLWSAGVYRSTDGGGSWKFLPITPGSTLGAPLVIDPQTPTNLYAGNFNGGVYKSTDGGESWNNSSNGLEEIDHYAQVLSLAIDPQRPSTVYAGTFDWGVFKSTDSGANWKAVNNGIRGNQIAPPIFTLAIDPQNPSSVYAGTGGGLFRTTDGGGSWIFSNVGFDVHSLVLDPQAPSAIYAGSPSIGVYKSPDGGTTWTPMNQGLTNLMVEALAIDPKNPSRIYAGTWGGGVFVTSAPDCSNSISTLNQFYASSGITSDHVNVTTAGGCGWTAASNDPWITISSGSSGAANGVVTFSVAPNTSPDSRAGTLTIAGETFTVTQAGLTSSFSVSSISPNMGPVTGGTSFTLQGGGFQVGASVSLGGVPATVNILTSAEVTATTGIATVPGSYDVVVTHPGGQSMVLIRGCTYTPVTGPQTGEAFVPIVLSVGGMNGSFFTSELTLTNRGTGTATVHFTYTASLGSGSGMVMDTLAPGQQKIVPDAISYLRSLGVPIPSSGSQGGTLRVSFSGLTSPADGSVTVRTATVVPEGRAGLAYAGIPTSTALTDPSYICGLRQNQTDRSNVAIQNVGSSSDGNITLQLTVFSGAGGAQISSVLPDQVLPPGEWAQISGILTSNGLSLSNGYVRVERVSGTAPYYAYGVINDQSNSDGSFIPPVPESALAGKTRMTLPVVVETSAFSTELVVTNWSTSKKTLGCRFVSDNVSTSDATASFTVDVNPFQQLIWPELVQKLRDSQITGIGAKGLDYAGALLISVSTGDLSGISVAARTSAAGGGGRYGLYYTAMPEGTTTTNTAWLYGLQQNSENRTNLALINTGETDSSVDTFRVELFNGDTGAKVATVDGLALAANHWYQIGTILSRYAPGVTQGHARITRTAGNNPFIAYAVINDGGQPSERTGDGAFVSSAP